MWIGPHVLKGMSLALSSRRGDHMLPPELMGRLGVDFQSIQNMI